MKVFVSPHYFYPSDKGWKFNGALEKFMHSKDMYEREGQLDMEGFEEGVIADASGSAKLPGVAYTGVRTVNEAGGRV